MKTVAMLMALIVLIGLRGQVTLRTSAVELKLRFDARQKIGRVLTAIVAWFSRFFS